MRTIHGGSVSYGWDRDRPPVLTASSGDEVELVLADASDGQLGPDSSAEDLAQVDGDRTNPLVGPLAVAGAEPGDGLLVHVLGVESAGWGWTAVIPGFGLLQEDFPDAHLRISRIGEGQVDLDGVATVPHRPFLGTIGVAADQAGVLDVIPPRHVGGNLDCKDIGPGTQLLLPVEVGGGLLSLGDGHAAQGDGEVCGTAVETPTVARIRVTRIPGGAPATPRMTLPSRPEPIAGDHLTTTGVGSDLMAGARHAVRQMIEELAARGLDPADAYLVCSVAGDLRIAEIVDAPNWVVAFTVPLAVLN